jgi:hypothetical protein
MPPLMDGIPSKRNSLRDVRIHMKFSNNQIPNKVRPNEVAALIYYLEAFDGIFGVFSRMKTLKI